MLPGTRSLGEECQPAPSSTSTACAPGLTRSLIAARCASIAAMFTSGMTTAAPVRRSGQTAPNSQAQV